MNGEFLNNLYMLGGLFVAFTTVVWLLTSANRRAAQRDADDIRRDLRRVEKGVRRDLRQVDKRLSGEIGKTNREVRRTNRQVRKTRKEVWWLRVDMQVVKDRLNIGTVSRPVAPLPVASDPEAASLAAPAPVADAPAPDSVVPVPVAAEPEPVPSEMSDPAVGDLGDSGSVASESGSVGSAPVEDIPEADVGSEAVADRPGPAGVVSPGFSATSLATEK